MPLLEGVRWENSRTPGSFAAKSKGEFARGHNLESVMDVEVPLVISGAGANLT
jgi:hypothetical protein